MVTKSGRGQNGVKKSRRLTVWTATQSGIQVKVHWIPILRGLLLLLRHSGMRNALCKEPRIDGRRDAMVSQQPQFVGPSRMRVILPYLHGLLSVHASSWVVPHLDTLPHPEVNHQVRAKVREDLAWLLGQREVDGANRKREVDVHTWLAGIQFDRGESSHQRTA